MKNRKPSRAARFMVLSGPVIALFLTLYVLVTGNGASLLFAAWFWAAVWTFLAALAGALWRGLRRGDWSAFRRRRLPDGRDERIDAATNSGQYAHLEIAEEHERLMRDD